MTTSTSIVAYIRGSTTEQKNTLDVQAEDCRNYCTYKRLDLIQLFEDSGTSAYSTQFLQRDVVREMLDYCQRNACAQIAVAKLDRAFRNTKDCLNTIDYFSKHGIEFHILDLNVDTRDPQGKFFLTIVAAMSELENGLRSQRQKAAFDNMRRQHQRTGTTPYGWTAVPSTRVSRTTGNPGFDLIPNADEQAVLDLMVDQYHNQGLSYAKIATALNDAGIPSKQGSIWRPGAVHRIIKSARLDLDDNVVYHTPNGMNDQ